MKKRHPKAHVAKAAEKAAQAIYDLRDCIPAADTRLWEKLDAQARRLSKYGARLLKEPFDA